MLTKINYQKELDKLIERNQKEGKTPRLFLHACCAPCSSYVMEYLSQYFEITIFFYNPNISPDEEYEERVSEQERLIRELNEEWSGDQSRTPVRFLSGPYEPERFYQAVKGLEKEPEGGLRCTECFSLRLEEAARLAAEGGYDFFTTTLSISPLKDAERLNRIGEEMGAKYGIAYLNSDFKKKNGYRRSIELSALHHLYRQDYCGCVYSKEAGQAQ